MPDEFWVLPCLETPFSYVVYRDNGREVQVEVKDGKITKMQEALTRFEKIYFERNILTKSNQ